jgi:hypothetical protein
MAGLQYEHKTDRISQPADPASDALSMANLLMYVFSDNESRVGRLLDQESSI